MKEDKIFVEIQDLGSGYAVDVSLTPKDEHIEYIRKDAIVEYINEELAENKGWKDTCWHDRYFGGYGVALENVLEKLNEL